MNHGLRMGNRADLVKKSTQRGDSGQPTLTFLHPGDVALAERGEVLETLLGSCIALMLTDPRQTVGVMCHIVNAALPPPRHRPGQIGLDARFGEPAFEAMALRLRVRGLDIQQCQAWLAGGGAPNVGESNVHWAHERLSRAGIELLGSDTGGHAARRVHWRVGEVPEVSVVSIEAAA